jgi:sugar phosphate isomerase/epimerase
MHLGFNTYVYEVAGWPIERTLKSGAALGFRYTEYAACGAGDPTHMSAAQRNEVIKLNDDLGLMSSQMLLAEVEHMAHPDAEVRAQVLDYMKRVSEFQLEMGGRQVIVCWGCGIHRLDMAPELAWLNSVDAIRRLAEWGQAAGLIVDLEVEPHTYFIVNSSDKAARMIEDVGVDNVYVNLDVGHFTINREPPDRIRKICTRIDHVHLSETQGYDHSNSIIGTGTVEFEPYVRKAIELGIEATCAGIGVPCVAGLEMGDPRYPVDDPERWMREALDYVRGILPELTQ